MSGPFGSSQWMYSSASGFYPHSIDQSLRFEDGDTAYLSRTPSSAGNLKTWTWSAWVKRTAITRTGNQTLFSQWEYPGNYQHKIVIGPSDELTFMLYDGGANSHRGSKTPAMKFRDVSSWYHIVCVFDTSNSTAEDRMRVYVNGTRITTFSSNAGAAGQSSSINPSLNRDGYVNRTQLHTIGTFYDPDFGAAFDLLDGYMAEVNFIDGTALTADSFGETKDGIWVAKDVSGLTYGTNGFHLDFADSSAIGNDVSGNDNDFAVSGLAATDVVLDSPTNNFATMNVLDKNSMTLSEGNLRPTPTGDFKGVRGNFAIPLTGKWFFEARVTTGGGGDITDSQIGIATDQNVLTGSSPYPQSANYAVIYFFSGKIRRLNSDAQTGLASFGSGDVIGVAINSTDNEVQFYKNGSAVGSAVALPSTTRNSFAFFVGATSRSSVFNFGQDSTFAGAVSAGSATDGVGTFQSLPTDFKALCSANLPEPAIISGEDYFNTVLYSGNGGTQDITTVGFQSDWVWNKRRDGAASHVIYDSVRGTGNEIGSNYNAAEATGVPGVTAFLSNGYSLGNNGNINDSGETYASWNWLAGTAVSGATTGSGTAKTYTGSVNTEAGFSIIKYVGNGTSGHTIPHNLGAVPKMIIAKNLDQADDWAVYHNAIGAGNYLKLNTTAASTSAAAVWNDATPSDSVFSVGSNHQTNANDEDYIAYCFADIDQYCKAGVYTGNGSADGTYVALNFRPAWVMIKRTDASADWWVLDNKRNSSNVVDLRLRPNSNSAEEGPDATFDFVANGLKIRGNYSTLNASGGTYIYLAFAEQPFKYSNAR